MLSMLLPVCLEDGQCQGSVGHVTPAASTGPSQGSAKRSSPLPTYLPPPRAQADSQQGPWVAHISWVVTSPPIWEPGLWINVSITLTCYHPGKCDIEHHVMADSMCQTDLWLVDLAVLTLEHFDVVWRKTLKMYENVSLPCLFYYLTMWRMSLTPPPLPKYEVLE